MSEKRAVAAPSNGLRDTLPQRGNEVCRIQQTTLQRCDAGVFSVLLFLIPAKVTTSSLKTPFHSINLIFKKNIPRSVWNDPGDAVERVISI